MWPLANCVKYAVAGTTKRRLLRAQGGWLTAKTHRAEPYRQCPGAEPRCRAVTLDVRYRRGWILSIRRGVADPTGAGGFTPEGGADWRSALLMSAPPSYASRVGVREPLITGVRAIDGLMTCGVGQRMGILHSAGCGKTMLMHIIL